MNAFSSYQVVNLVRRGVVNLNRPDMVSLNRREVVNYTDVSTLQDNQHFPVSIFEIVERCTYIISANSS